MSVTTTTHLTFHGNARQALELYRTVFGGEISAATYADMGMPESAPGAQGLVFGLLESPSGFRVMAYDVPGQTAGAVSAGCTYRENGMTVTDQPFFLSIRGADVEEVQGYWDALAEGSSIIEPFAASPWSPGFGMLTDPFGVTWVIDVAPVP